MEHFIESVRKHSCLWKVDAEEYKNNEIKDAEWRNVIKECDIPNVKEAKSLWKKLRDSHRQALNKRKTTTGQAASSDNRMWKYEKIMEFLLPHMANRSRCTNAASLMNIQDESQIDETIENTQPTIDSDINETIDEPQQVANIPRTKRKCDKLTVYLENEQKRRDKRSEERDLFRQKLLNLEQSDKPKQKSAMETFFESMCAMSSSLPESLQIKVQRQIFNIVMDAREETLQRQSQLSGRTFLTTTVGNTPFSHPFTYRNVPIRPQHSSSSNISQSLNDQVSSPAALSSNSESYDALSPGINAVPREDLQSSIPNQSTYTNIY